jgi:hypothetical protein
MVVEYEDVADAASGADDLPEEGVGVAVGSDIENESDGDGAGVLAHDDVEIDPPVLAVEPAHVAMEVPMPLPAAWEPPNEIVHYFHTGSSKVTYYPKKKAFEIVCGHHANCRATRKCTAANAALWGTRLKPSQGRCAGFALAWLVAAEDACCSSKDLHLPFEPSHAKRLEARATLQSTPQGRLLLRCERPKRDDGEESEDNVCP